MKLTGFKKHPIYKEYMFNVYGDCYSLKSNKKLKPTYNKQGYLRFGLYIDGKSKTLSAHRLIAQTFLCNKENYRDVNHINGIKNDNRVENLEWCTHSYNIKHAFDNGLNKVSEYAKKLTSCRNKEYMLNNHPNKRKVICYSKSGDFIRKFDSIRDASNFYNILESSISNCLSNRSKTAGKKIWRYE